MEIYSSSILQIGEQANLFLDEGIIVFFGDNAPEELKEFSILHKLNKINGQIEVGDQIVLSGSKLEVTAVGHVANENFKNLGHLVLKLDAADEPALPGDVSCKYNQVPKVNIGDKLKIIK